MMIAALPMRRRLQKYQLIDIVDRLGISHARVVAAATEIRRCALL